jgi:subtilisin family serine protease
VKLITFILLFTIQVQATIRVAVIDSGFDFDSNWKNSTVEDLSKPKLCSEGHTNFVFSRDLSDSLGHGTHIAGIIGKNNQDTDYCLVILKYYDPWYLNTQGATIKAFNKAIELDVDIINYSGGGIEFSRLECQVVSKALDAGIVVIAAAGNEHNELTKVPYYPAMCDERVIKVTNIYTNGQYTFTSNKDNTNTIKNVIKETGVSVWSLFPGNRFTYLSGTSQACAKVTNRMIKKLEKLKYRDKLIHNRYYDKWSNI